MSMDFLEVIDRMCVWTGNDRSVDFTLRIDWITDLYVVQWNHFLLGVLNEDDVENPRRALGLPSVR